MKKYEYLEETHMVSKDDPFEDFLNRLGEQGWRLVVAERKFSNNLNKKYHRCVLIREKE